MRVVGLMSGTSYDAINVAAADLRVEDDTVVLTPLGDESLPYDDALRERIAAALPPHALTAHDFCVLDTRLGQAFGEAAAHAVAALCDGSADLISSHGQTIYHWVDDGDVRATLQLGQPAWIAERTGCPVVSDLRARDVAAGGQGAPLVNLFDVLLLGRRPDAPRAALNLGGIANVTVVSPVADPIAFDTGPASALLDALLDDVYLRRTPPKTTGKERYHLDYVEQALASVTGPVADDDLLATLTRFTARTIADAVRPLGVTSVVAAGGGTANPTLMAMLADALGPATLTTIDDRGVSADAKEAYAFALLGYLSVHQVPGVVASCTGARHASVLGNLTPGRDGFPQCRPVTRSPQRLRIEERVSA